MAQASITVNYSIEPPDGVQMTELLKKESMIKADVSASQGGTGYYESLRSALAEAKTRVGAELTSWRDAVGSLENAKEPKKGAKLDSDEEEEEIEEE